MLKHVRLRRQHASARLLCQPAIHSRALTALENGLDTPEKHRLLDRQITFVNTLSELPNSLDNPVKAAIIITKFIINIRFILERLDVHLHVYEAGSVAAASSS